MAAVTQGGNTLHLSYPETAFGLCGWFWATGAAGCLFTGHHARHLFGLAF